ncbi:hypothetical protein GW796_00285 [archaeon]|nr:hypothetical protein [archaeon]
MSFFIFLVALIVLYFIISYRHLIKYHNQVNSIYKTLSNAIDHRFSLFEDLINKSSTIISHEETFINDIIQLRLQAQKFKQNNDLRASFSCEEKISKLAKKINLLFEEFSLLNKILESQNIQENILKEEIFLLELKNKYNESVIQYNKKRSSSWNYITSHLFDVFSIHHDIWIITD